MARSFQQCRVDSPFYKHIFLACIEPPWWPCLASHLSQDSPDDILLFLFLMKIIWLSLYDIDACNQFTLKWLYHSSKLWTRRMHPSYLMSANQYYLIQLLYGQKVHCIRIACMDRLLSGGCWRKWLYMQCMAITAILHLCILVLNCYKQSGKVVLVQKLFTNWNYHNSIYLVKRYIDEWLPVVYA